MTFDGDELIKLMTEEADIMPWITTAEACDVLRVSEDNMEIVDPLVTAAAQAVYDTTGMEANSGHPLAYALARLWLAYLFDADGTDADKLRRSIDTLTFVVRADSIAHGIDPQR